MEGRSPRQLWMLLPSLENLPPVRLPPGYEFRTFREGDEEVWCEIVNATMGGRHTPEQLRKNFTGREEFDPEGMFFITFGGRPVGTAFAWREKLDGGEIGRVHYVAVLEEHRGKGLGTAVTLLVLHRLREWGFKRAVLSTDDFRLPAIKVYLRLGFKPVYFDDEHRERWRKVLEQLGMEAEGVDGAEILTLALRG